jgi:hypothetical protein
MKPIHLACATAATLLVTASAGLACPAQGASGAALSYTGGQLYTRQIVTTQASGASPIANCGIPGAWGYTNQAPAYSLYLNQMDGYRLVLTVGSNCDPTLLARTPDGQWHFDDDSAGGLDPRLELENGAQLNGRVDLWVGSYDGQSCPANLALETFRAAGVADEAGDVPLGVAGCPNPMLNGPITSYTGAQLLSRWSLETTAAGSTDLSGCNLPDAWGYANTVPSHTFYLSGTEGYRLDLTVDASCDSTMLVHAADGSWHFNDDGNGNLDPAISLAQPNQTTGRVDVWVGSYGGATCAAALNLQTVPVAAPPSGAPLPPPQVGCPNPGLSGPTLAYSGGQLWTRQSLPVQASGSTQLADCGIEGTRGYANPAPSYSLYLSEMQDYRLDLTAEASCDSTMLVRTPDGQWHFNDDGHGNYNPLISLTPPTALEGRVDVWVGTYGPTPCAATLNLETFGRDKGTGIAPTPPLPPQTGATTPAPGDPALQGRWSVNANGFAGTLSFAWTGTGWSGQLNLGRQETLQDVSFDPASGRVTFLRPDPTYPQHYMGTLSGGTLSGQFNQQGGGYVYAWSAQR